MRLLLDTHVAIWALSDSRRLSRPVLQLIQSVENEVCLSAASIWEIAIKFRLGKISAPPFSGTTAIRMAKEAGYVLVDVSAAHAAAVDSVDLDHADPFDRLILAQALTEPMRLVTRDAKLAAYGDNVITW